MDNSPWFVAADVCKALGLSNAANRVSVTVSQEYTKRGKLQGQRGLPTILVAEAGLYTLVMRSDKPEAKAFQDWVTGVVLPAIINTANSVAASVDQIYTKREKLQGQPSICFAGRPKSESLLRVSLRRSLLKLPFKVGCWPRSE
jgi:prophage antirepressor-like protein